MGTIIKFAPVAYTAAIVSYASRLVGRKAGCVDEYTGIFPVGILISAAPTSTAASNPSNTGYA